jgi:hypothetical protein
VEPTIVIIAMLVLAIGGVFAGRAWTGGDPQRDYRLLRGAYAAAVVFAFTWVVGYILAWPLLTDFGITGAVACGAVAATASQRLVKRGKGR